MCKYGMDRSYGIYGQGNFVNSFRVPSLTLSMLLIFLARRLGFGKWRIYLYHAVF